MAEFGKSTGALWVRGALQGVMVLRRAVLVMGLSAGLVACGGSDEAASRSTATAPAPWDLAVAADTASAEPAAASRTVLVLGDSLSAAYNLAAEQGWVALLDARMRTQAPEYRMVNASISGETSAGGASRIDAALAEHRPAIVVIELGANDGLRGLPLEETRANLERMVRASRAAGAAVLVVGMRLPPNYGPDYTEAFHGLFGEIAAAEGVAHLPFLLEPIAMDEAAFQPDRLHPTAEAQPVLADHVWTALGPMLVASPAAD